MMWPLRPGDGGARNRWLPEGRRGPMPWIIAVMMFLTFLAGATGLGLAHALIQMRGQLSGGYTIQIVEADAAQRAEQVSGIESYLKHEKAIKSFAAVPASRLQEQLEPWIGPAVRTDEIPVPALIDLEMMPGTEANRIAQIGRTVARIAPKARLDAHQHYLAPVERLMRTLMWIAGGLAAMMIIVTGAVVVLAARNAHETHRATIDIMHLLGATDMQIARLFQRRIALDALFGSVIGTMAAALLLWLLGRSLIATGSELTGMAVFSWRSAAVLLTLPIFGVLVAATTARITVKRALERTL